MTTGIPQQAQREKQMRRIILAADTAIGPRAGVCRVVSSKQVRRLASEPLSGEFGKPALDLIDP